MLGLLPRLPRGRLPVSPKARTAPAVSSAPAWFTALTPNTLSFVSSNSIASTGSTTAAITTAWNGMAVDQSRREAVLGNNGGHFDYGGNEMLVLQAWRDSPQYVRTRAPGTITAADSQNGAGYHADGAPLATHTYANQCAANGRYWLPGLGAQGGDGNWTTALFSYDLEQQSAGVYNRHGRIWTSTPGMSWLGGSSALDPVDNAIWCYGQFGDDNRLTKIDIATVLAAGNLDFPAATPGVTRYELIPNPGYSYTMVADDLRLLISRAVNYGTFYFDLTNPAAGSFAPAAITGPGTLAPYTSGHMVWHKASRAMVGWPGSGTSFRKCVVSTPVSGTWASSDVAMAGSWASEPGNGTFSRFNVIEDMGNGESCFLYVRHVDDAGFYACRVVGAL